MRVRDGVLFGTLVLIFSTRADAQPSSVVAQRDTEDQSPSTSSTPKQALELAASLGPTVVFGEPANPDLAPSANHWGASISALVAYRSSYFVIPSLEVGYAWLARGDAELPEGPW